MKFFNHTIIDEVRLNNHGAGSGTAYVLDRLENKPTLEEIAYWEKHGAIVSTRAYRYAPEIVETFVFVPDEVMVWACPDCSGVYGEDPQILERSADDWTCPVCGRSTSYPDQDLCFPMIELV